MRVRRRTIFCAFVVASSFLVYQLWSQDKLQVTTTVSIDNGGDPTTAHIGAAEAQPVCKHVGKAQNVTSTTDEDADQGGKKGLSKDDVLAAKFCVDHHPAKFDENGFAAGGTRVPPAVPGEDNLHCWGLRLNDTTLGDLNGDGRGDAVATVTYDSPWRQEVHLIPFINKNGEAVQTGDLVVREVWAPDELKIESGKCSVDFCNETTPHDPHCQFKLVDGKLVIIPSAKTLKAQSFTEVPLTVNSQDVLLPKLPERYADMISRGAVIKTGVRATKMTKQIVQKALILNQKRLDIGDFWSGPPTISQIALGDFTGDGRQCAAAIVSTGRADHDQLDLIPVVIEQGQLTLYGVVPLGGGGYDTWDWKVAIKSGQIKVRIKIGEKFSYPKDQHWMAWNFEVRKSKLIKVW